MAVPKPEDVRAQLERLYAYSRFRGPKLRRLLGFLVEEWLKDRGKNLSLMYIGYSLQDEPLTLEEVTRKYEKAGEGKRVGEKWSYPKTKSNLRHVRTRLMTYFETEGYRDRVIVKINAGSYVPEIGYNPVVAALPDLEPAVENLILRAKTAIDARTLRGALRAAHYGERIPVNWENPRQAAGMLFIEWAAASIAPVQAANDVPFAEMAITQIKKTGFEPWEGIFVEACVEACSRHDWLKALDLFELAVTNSLGEAQYFWWYTALLACVGKTERAIEILDGAVRHFLRTNFATRTDLAILQTMAGRFEEAEEVLSASLDFVSITNPRMVFSLAVLFEAQDRLESAAALITQMYDQTSSAMSESSQAVINSFLTGEFEYTESNTDKIISITEGHYFIGGLLALILGRMNQVVFASEIVDALLRLKALERTLPSLEIAIGMIGLGRFDDSVEWLRKAAFEEHDAFAMWFGIFPPLRHLKGHRKFDDLLKDLNLAR